MRKQYNPLENFEPIKRSIPVEIDGVIKYFTPYGNEDTIEEKRRAMLGYGKGLITIINKEEK